LAIEKLKSRKTPGIVQILAECIKAGDKTIRCEIHEFIISIWNKEKLPEEWKESIIAPNYEQGDKRTAVNIGVYHFRQLLTNFYPTSCCQG
jgi:hypothetical protein